MSPVVDAVIVAYESADRLRRLIPALQHERSVGTVVVVDHGNDGSDAVAEACGARVLRDRSNPGFGAGQNRGVAYATGDYVLVVNPDLVPAEGAVTAGVAFLDAHPEAAAVQGVIRSEEDGAPERSAGRSLKPVHLWGRLLRLRRLLKLKSLRRVARRWPLLSDHIDRAPVEARAVEALAATMLLIRREAFDSVGGFDEGFFLYGEDLDLCSRLREAGWELWAVPETWATHASGESSRGRWERELVWWEGTMRFAALHWPLGSFAVGLAAAATRACSLAALRPRAGRQAFERLLVNALSARRRRR